MGDTFNCSFSSCSRPINHANIAGEEPPPPLPLSRRGTLFRRRSMSFFNPPVVVRSVSLHFAPYLWAGDYTQLRASLGELRRVAACYRCHRYLAEVLLVSGGKRSHAIPHTPIKTPAQIFFSSACPAKGSAPVITYTCMQHPEDLPLFPCLSALLRRRSSSLPHFCLKGQASV